MRFTFNANSQTHRLLIKLCLATNSKHRGEA
jgi:hypothetical protein